MVRHGHGLAAERRGRLHRLVAAISLSRVRLAAPVFSNASFWAGSGAVPVMVLAVAIDVPGFVAPLPTWESVVATSGMGFALAGPVAAAGSAVAVATARQWRAGSGTRPTRPVWQQVLQRIWPAWLALIVGFGICLVSVATATSPDTGGDQLVAVVVAVASAVSIPVIAGAMVGCSVTAVVAGPLTLIVGYAISAFGLVDPALISLGVLGGTWLPHATQSLDASISPALLIGPPLAFLALAAMLRVADRRRILARGAALLGVVAVVGGMLASPLMDVRAPGTVARSASALHCVGVDVELCLWPEVERDRDELTTHIAAFNAVLERAALPTPSTVTPHPEGAADLFLSTRVTDPADWIAVQFGESYTWSIGCLDSTGSMPISSVGPQSEEESEAMLRASGLLSAALGGDPGYAASALGWTPAAGTDPLQHLGAADPESALFAFADWVDTIQEHCGVANAT